MKATALYLWLVLALGGFAEGKDWWNHDWSIRRQITIDTSANAGAITEPIGSAVVLVRLHDGNFQFASAKEDGSDVRFISEDGKTLLPFHLERYDALLNEAFAWVKLPEIKSSGATSFWLYYGNTEAKAASVADPKGTYDANSALVYHFGERNAPPIDTTKNANSAESAGIDVEGAAIGGGIRLSGTAITIPASPSLAWAEQATVSLSLWIKLTTLSTHSVILTRRDGDRSFVLGADQGVPFVEIKDAAGAHRTASGAPLAISSWHHLAVVAAAGRVNLSLDGEQYASLDASLPALNTPLLIGGDSIEESVAQLCELDELNIVNATLTSGALKFAAFSQGSEKAAKLITFAEEEQAGGGGGHSGYLSVIVGSLTIDGWVVICLLGVMALISWWVMISKVIYLNGLSKGNALFMAQWRQLAADLTGLDHGDTEKVKSLGGRVDSQAQLSMSKSSVYRIYHLGAEEIRHRLAADRSIKVLSSRSIQAIRATLDGGLVREKQHIDRLIVLLTICISGGPFLGLLGTVVGVMITFAAVAAAGDVNVNAIAPGIAAALLATVAGLAVAIPSLFGYNYILSRVKDATADMHVFIDEFTTKMAEFYAGTDADRRPSVDATPLTAASLRELLRGLAATPDASPAHASAGL